MIHAYKTIRYNIKLKIKCENLWKDQCNKFKYIY